MGWEGGRWGGRVGGCLGQYVGCYKLICDVADQRNVSLSSGFRDIHLCHYHSINDNSFLVDFHVHKHKQKCILREYFKPFLKAKAQYCEMPKKYL